MLLEIVTSMRLFEAKVQQPKDHEMIFSQKDVITLTAELTAHSSVLRISKALQGNKCHRLSQKQHIFRVAFD